MKIKNNIFAAYFAGVMELVDMLDLGSSERSRVGSSPSNCSLNDKGTTQRALPHFTQNQVSCE